MPKLLLIDGNYYVYRSFHAIRGLTNSRGEPTNAIYGFVRAVRKMLAEIKPDLAGIAWDFGLPKRRTELQPEYKAQRPKMPEEMRPQIKFLRETMPLMGLAELRLPDTEADDLIASYAHKALEKDFEVIIATNDKDIMQLVSDRVLIYSVNKVDIGTSKNGFALLGAKEVEGKWLVKPAQIKDVLALTGDSVDNILGVKGVGIKTAAKLVNQFGSIKALLENIDAISEERIREAVRSQSQQVVDNLEMVCLETDLPLPIPLEEMKIHVQYEPLINALKSCDLKSITQEIINEWNAKQDLFS